MTGKKTMTSRAFACLAALVLVMAVALTALPQSAYADEDDLIERGVASAAAGQDLAMKLGRDLVFAGDKLAIDGDTVDNDLLFIGSSLTASDLDVAGSIRAIGSKVVVRDCAVKENLTLAGETILVAGGKANDVSLAGDTVTYEGTCESLRATGSIVEINGTVNGDADVYAAQVKIGPDANITGTLRLSAAAEPVIPATATIGNYSFSLDDGSNSSAMIEGVLGGLVGILAVLGVLISLVGSAIVALLSELFFKRHTLGAGQMLRARPGKTILSGIIAAIAIPVAIVILLCLIVTISVAVVLLYGALALIVVSTGFMGAALARMLFPNMKRILAALLGGLALGVLSIIPVVGTIVGIIASVLMLGYVIQRIFLSMTDRDIEMGQPAGEDRFLGE